MWRGLVTLVCGLVLPCAVLAEGAPLTLRAKSAEIEAGWFGQTTLRIGLSQAAPYRVFVMDGPRRLVLDVKGLTGGGVARVAGGKITALEQSVPREGWGRIVALLSEPMLPEVITLRGATLEVVLRRADVTEFAEVVARAGGETVPARPDRSDDVLRVVIDPGHGGVDPGAVQAGVYEKDLMLVWAKELSQALERTGQATGFLTRETDRFVSLPDRIEFAQEVEGDVFISLHADAIEEGVARGATVYTLSETASDAVAARLAAEHDRAGIISGLDLKEADDQVVALLTELARRETDPRTERFAEILAAGIQASGAPMHVKPRRQAAFSVLQSPDIPSVLLEIGFMSDGRDLANLRDPVWRRDMVETIAAALLDWQSGEAMRPGELSR